MVFTRYSILNNFQEQNTSNILDAFGPDSAKIGLHLLFCNEFDLHCGVYRKGIASI